MPIYEYRCPQCGNEFEEWQKITDPNTANCPNCNGMSNRLISQSSFILKGTGWYVTDYARKDGSSSPANSEKKSEEPKKTEAKTSDTKSSETKTTKSDTKTSATTKTTT